MKKHKFTKAEMVKGFTGAFRQKPMLVLCLLTARHFTATQFVTLVMSAVLATHSQIMASLWFLVMGMAVDCLLDYLHHKAHEKDREKVKGVAKDALKALNSITDELLKAKERMDTDYEKIKSKFEATRLSPEGAGTEPANSNSNNDEKVVNNETNT